MASRIPYIMVERLDSENADFGTKVLKMLVADLKVSGHFQTDDGGVNKSKDINYEELCREKGRFTRTN